MLLETSGTRNLHYRIKCEAMRPFRLTSIDLIKKGLPNALEGYKIIQLSDMHFGPCTSESHLRKAVSICGELKPDSIVLTGDYVQYSYTGFRHLLATKVSPNTFHWKDYRRKVRALSARLCRMLETLNPPNGIFAILGNHDHQEGLGTIRRQLKPAVSWLENSAAVIDKGGRARIEIAGLDDIRCGKPDLAKTLDLVPDQSNAHVRILLSHNPDVVTLKEAGMLKDVDLVLCGHTHGGQICLPGGIPLVSRTKNKNFIAGMGEFQGTPVYVNSGLGYGGITLRTFCPPEITLITLRSS